MFSSQPAQLSATARAFATYSLVPYLGILFCPGAVLFGGAGVVRSYFTEVKDGSRTACYLSLLAGVVILAIQVLLWWILYKVPVWTRGF